jgi:AraC-like DNA-binding protein
LIEATHAFFRDHLGERITLTRVARHLAMSRSAFSHRYRELAGETPMRALLSMRIVEAKRLLLRGVRMEAIAHELGFFDASHFSKAFKRQCGLSPSRFRRDVLQLAASAGR